MTDIVERLRFDAARCEATFSKGVAKNIEAAIAEIERLRDAYAELMALTDELPVRLLRESERRNGLRAKFDALISQKQS